MNPGTLLPPVMGALWGAVVGGAQDLTDVILSASLSSMAGGGGEDASASGNDLGPPHQCTHIEEDVDKNFFDLSGMCVVAKNPDRCFVMDSDECVPGICCADDKCVPDCVTLSGGFAAFIQVMCLFMVRKPPPLPPGLGKPSCIKSLPAI